jgi:hypothetical protein
MITKPLSENSPVGTKRPRLGRGMRRRVRGRMPHTAGVPPNTVRFVNAAAGMNEEAAGRMPAPPVARASCPEPSVSPSCANLTVLGETPALPIFQSLARQAAAAAMLAWVLTVVPAAAAAAAPTNLLPNGGFAGKDPLHGWLTTFPDEAFYQDNGRCVKIAPPAAVGGRKAVMLELPAGIAGNQGGKLESVPVPVEPGASYHIAVDCMTWDLSARIHAEVWSRDPHPEQKRTIFRRAPAGGRPALMMCYRAQVPAPPSNSKAWTSAGRDFTVPTTVVVAGKPQAPEFISVKVVNYGATMAAGKSYFANFRLFRVAPATGAQKDQPKP